MTDNVATRALVNALYAVTDGLACELFGDPSERSKTQLRFGTKGSKVVTIAGQSAGSFYDFETGCGGGPLEMIASAIGCSLPEAKIYAQDYLANRGLPMERADPPISTDTSGDVEERIARANRIWKAGQKIQMPWIRRYLRLRHLGLSILRDARQINNPPYGPALMIPIRKADGQITAVHIIKLNVETIQEAWDKSKDGHIAGDRPKLTIKKRTYGAIKGQGSYAVIADRGSRILLATEGPENAIAIAMAFPEFSIACVFSSSNFYQLDGRTGARGLVIINDGDADQSADIPRVNAVEDLRAKGYRAMIGKLPHGQDANDILIASDAQGLRTSVMKMNECLRRICEDQKPLLAD